MKSYKSKEPGKEWVKERQYRKSWALNEKSFNTVSENWFKLETKASKCCKLITDKVELATDYDAIILAVSHKEFLDIKIDDLKSENCVTFDVKSLLPLDIIDARL